jgi:hypothetical protein
MDLNKNKNVFTQYLISIIAGFLPSYIAGLIKQNLSFFAFTKPSSTYLDIGLILLAIALFISFLVLKIRFKKWLFILISIISILLNSTLFAIYGFMLIFSLIFR